MLDAAVDLDRLVAHSGEGDDGGARAFGPVLREGLEVLALAQGQLGHHLGGRHRALAAAGVPADLGQALSQRCAVVAVSSMDTATPLPNASKSSGMPTPHPCDHVPAVAFRWVMRRARACPVPPITEGRKRRARGPESSPGKRAVIIPPGQSYGFTMRARNTDSRCYNHAVLTYLARGARS